MHGNALEYDIRVHVIVVFSIEVGIAWKNKAIGQQE